MPEFIYPPNTEPLWLPKLLVALGLAASNSEARRAVQQGAVKINGEKVTNPDMDVVLADQMVLQVGKRKFAKIKIQ